MHINVSTENGGNDKYMKLKLSFDLYGNLYFDINKNHEYFTNALEFSSFQINVDGRNNLYGYEGDYDVIETKNGKLTKFKLTAEHSKLQNKVIKELESNEVEQEIYDTFDDMDIDPDMIDPYEDEIKHFPERGEYFDVDVISSEDIIDEDIINMYGHHNIKFNFSHASDDMMIPIHNRKDGDITALYDTYVYNDNDLCFKSSSKEDESIYTIKIHNDGTVYFRPHGFQEQRYTTLLTKNGKLLFIRH